MMTEIARWLTVKHKVLIIRTKSIGKKEHK